MTRPEIQIMAPPVPVSTAESLRHALARLGVSADVHAGFGLALVSVWVGLVVWCDGERYWWRTGWDTGRKRPVYAWHPAQDTARAAHRVAMRCADLRENHPLSYLVNDLTSAAQGQHDATG
ncbi:hypothetical protein ACFWY5_27305 [Nonomuraea sp. NPDC059007]|uniref:hypothetical protein n=1 Tax=Nonomuraea sp. NPDC059007 TaxID=3346692 RepID=UPI0036AD1B87